MRREPIIMVCTCEIAGRVRGKGFPASELPSRLRKGVGWIPTNTMISALGAIADTPFGAIDDLILVPDPAARVQVDFQDDSAPESFFLGDIRRTDGTPWEGCPRNFLRRALDDLQQAAGLRLFAAFEHEFTYGGVEDRPGSPYSLDAYRRQGVFGEVLVAALRQAGVVPDSFLPEFGARQYEVTCEPTLGLRAADDAVILREMTRATAYRLGQRVSFTPIHDPNGVGNGVHIHFSFRDPDGRPAMYDPAGPYGLSEVGQWFLAGVVRHLPAICALTAPSPVSYIRLRPNRWAPTLAYVANQDREASLRICPVLTVPGADSGAQFNVEFRSTDASASPYLALGALVHAGVDGIRNRFELTLVEGVAAMSEEERLAAGIVPLPASLAEALDKLEALAVVEQWLGKTYLNAYLRHKRAELRMVAGLDEAALCTLYGNTY